MSATPLPPWLAHLGRLLDVARLGAQFPDARRWRALVELLGRGGPRGRPLRVSFSPESGLISARSLRHLHRLQFVAREFFATHRQRPSKEARAFSMALAALELPPLRETHARLIHQASGAARFLLTHERLELTSVRFSLVVSQPRRGPISLGKDQLAQLPEPFVAAVSKACAHGAAEAWAALEGVEGLTVHEVTRGELGPLASTGPVPASAPQVLRALQALCRAPDDAVLSVVLERLAPDVARDLVRDPWAPPSVPSPPGARLARERRLFCTPGLEPSVRALAPGVLVRAR
ncbi:MAG: hypothetical protein ACOZQL_31820 [Myxococcota bacterium]